MAAMTKNAMFFLSKAVPRAPSFSPRPKFSRVCFSANSTPEGFHASEDYKRRDYEKGYAGDRTVGDAAAEMAEKTRENVRGAADRTKERTQEMKENAKGGAAKAAEKAKEYAHETKETTKEAAGATAERTKEGANKAAEAAQSIGEKAKETVQGAWGAAKETGQKIKETVVGKSEDVDDYVEDHTKPRKDSPEGKTMDEDVVELRRRAGDNKL